MGAGSAESPPTIAATAAASPAKTTQTSSQSRDSPPHRPLPPCWTTEGEEELLLPLTLPEREERDSELHIYHHRRRKRSGFFPATETQGCVHFNSHSFLSPVILRRKLKHSTERDRFESVNRTFVPTRSCSGIQGLNRFQLNRSDSASWIFLSGNHYHARN